MEPPEIVHKLCRRVTDPIFFHGQFLSGGHNEKTENATVTFLKHNNRFFAVTCRHVVKHVKENQMLSLMIERLVLNFGSFTLDQKYVTSFALTADEHVDIAVCALGEGPWTMLSTKKEKTFIDLDSFNLPDWSAIKICCAAGYPTEHKSKEGDKIQSPMFLVVAELQSAVSAGATSFTLHSKLPEPHKSYFSGMSGGPIFAESPDNMYFPIGIIYEGMPASKDSPPSFFIADDRDICIRGLVLTPEIFQSWLEQLKIPAS